MSKVPNTPLGERNQCDGCARGLPIRPGMFTGTPIHFDQQTDNAIMACTADRYVKRYGENNVAA